MLPVVEEEVVAAVVELDENGDPIVVEVEDDTVEVDYWPFVFSAPGVMIMSIGVWVLYSKLFATNTPTLKGGRQNRGHADMRHITAKELEALSEEERQVLKKLLMENIREDTNGLI
jgi:hypothetical protein